MEASKKTRCSGADFRCHWQKWQFEVGMFLTLRGRVDPRRNMKLASYLGTHATSPGNGRGRMELVRGMPSHGVSSHKRDLRSGLCSPGVKVWLYENETSSTSLPHTLAGCLSYIRADIHTLDTERIRRRSWTDTGQTFDRELVIQKVAGPKF